ncbi:hypothetical protein LOD99_13378 [Oopsacas minuta]|uniref:C2H2-type domain-containing protein n=1 Tax=Oopsacas minuta TaxID=111878 RepID=A0AAV7KKN0_9METZ|nr:hypothetical protein LOD99_13378 [Oopsacas minuta]
MTTDSIESVRQLRKRSNSSHPIYNFTKAQKIVRESQPSRKCVDLFEKYFPFFLDQQNLLNELRKSVRESEKNKAADQQDDTSTHSLEDDHRSDVILSPTDDSPIENNVNEEDPETGNVLNCQFIVELESNCGNDVIECKLLPNEHSQSSPSADIVESAGPHIADTNPSTIAEDYITLISNEDFVDKPTRPDSELVSYEVAGGDCEIMREYLESSRQEFSNGEISVSKITDATYDILPGDPSQNSLAVWDSRLVSGDTQSVLSDDAIDCELLREEDSDKYSEDSIEYNILYVSENASTDCNNPSNSYQIHHNVIDNQERTGSELSCEISEQMCHKSSSVPSIINFIDNPSEHEQEDQINASSTIHTNLQTIQLISTQEFDNFPCQFCTSHFNTSADLECHLNTHRGTVLSASSVSTDKIPSKKYNPSKSSNRLNPKYQCQICFRGYQSCNGLKYHMNLHTKVSHPFDELFGGPNSKVNTQTSTKSPTIQATTVKCFYCPYQATYKLLLLDHLIIHKIDKAYYSCPECDFKIKHQKLIILHIYENHEEFFDTHNLSQIPDTKGVLAPLTGTLSNAPLAPRHSNLTQTAKKQKLKVTHHNLKKSNTKSKRRRFTIKKKRHPRQTHFSIESDNNTGNLILRKTARLLQESFNSKEDSKPELIKNLFDCIYCIKGFPTKHEIYSHLFTHIDAKTNSFLCPICVHPYKLPRFVIKHYQTCHQESVLKLSESQMDDEDYIVSHSSSLSS